MFPKLDFVENQAVANAFNNLKTYINEQLQQFNNSIVDLQNRLKYKYNNYEEGKEDVLLAYTEIPSSFEVSTSNSITVKDKIGDSGKELTYKYPLYNDFTEPELQYFRDMCNFSDEELQCFNLRAKNKSIVEMALSMNCSEAKISKLIKRVKTKIKKIL